MRESATRAREMDCPRPLNLVWQGPGPDETRFCREPEAPRGQEHYGTVPIRAVHLAKRAVVGKRPEDLGRRRLLKRVAG